MTGEVMVVDRVETPNKKNSGLTCDGMDTGVKKSGSSSADNYDGGGM